MYMSNKLIDNFYWFDRNSVVGSDAEKYKMFADMAGKARGKNPNAFDAVTEWILDDSEWTADKLAENEQILMHGIVARFKEQNAWLRGCLKELEPSGVVNMTVFRMLDGFDDELSEVPREECLREPVGEMFADFSVMLDRALRVQIAGEKTGPAGVDSVEVFGYINFLKGCDASVQWALFMPFVVESQQDGFKLDSLEYKTMPAIRFIGREGSDLEDVDIRKELFRTLEAMGEYKSGFDYDVFFMHHYGLGVDVGPWHGFWGRFMKADTPVPDGLVGFDFVPNGGDKPGLPFMPQFAYASFSGDMEAMHKREGYDVDAMYDVTRNIMLGQGVNIPYPDKYWTAEVFPDGCGEYSTAYMFSAEL